jgi:type I restriction enzyme S subunit
MADDMTMPKDEKSKVPQIRFKGFVGEWEEKMLGECVEFFNGLTYSPHNVQKGVGTLVLRSSNVKNGEIINADNVYVAPNVVNSKNVEVGDIAVVVRNGSRSLIGKHAQIKNRMDNTVIGAFMTGIHSEHPTFINALLDTAQFDKEISKNLGATINQITTGAFRQMMFWFPNPSEQTQIGTYFRQLDQLIQQHQHKHDKLATLKKAMLQKMFPQAGAATPEIRFKGFSNPWDSIEMEKLGQTYLGLFGKTKDDFGCGEGRFLTYMGVFSHAISNLNDTDAIGVDPTQNEVRKGDVLFTISSETPHEVGMSSVWSEDAKNIYLNSFCFGFRPLPSLKSDFLAYVFRADAFRKRICVLAQGISRYNISKTKVMKIPVSIPDSAEQKKIGTYFRQLDELISRHATQLEKLKQLKAACLEKMFV